ncbi:hypothetical protein NDU88_006757 [Pleurodeles waltl]|uniref:Uncharacterized protein n=1 Tax=Pleurodeles waltl TaxID=8319 RepID=A0AAV7MDY6_PLEWA|nr:hypothetical protein NDU88_006757 [Pleurodeles waltl]
MKPASGFGSAVSWSPGWIQNEEDAVREKESRYVRFQSRTKPVFENMLADIVINLMANFGQRFTIIKKNKCG